MVQVCAGVGYAHRAGLVHCDIKPHNILITPDKRVKVTDFGIARVLATIHPEEKAEIVWGSPQYFSPEQAAGLAPSPASDVYSLGVVMYEMLTGQLPFISSSAEELARMHRDMPPPSPRRLNKEIPSTLEQILIKVLSKEPANRYRTADQLGRLLINFASNSAPAQTIRPTPSERPKPVTDPGLPPQQPTPTLDANPSASPSRDPLDVDWLTILIALVALIAVGGLVPFYLWVFFQFR
jgi:serine/threonine-protein kinase